MRGEIIAAFLVITIMLLSLSYVSALSEKNMKKIDFIHYANPENKNSGNVKNKGCYDFITFAKLDGTLIDLKQHNLPVNYVINPSNSQGIPENFVIDAIQSSADTWNNERKEELFNGYTLDYNISRPMVDGKNSIAFSDIFLDTSIIASASLYTEIDSDNIIEFDIALNSKIQFGDASLNPYVIDIQSVITHELGHGLGLNDIYDSKCSDVTMYVYGFFGETQKRTLEKPDIKGLKKIY